MTRRPRPHRLRRGAIVDRPARDAALDERDLLLRRSLDVEWHCDRARVHRVIEEREVIAGDPLADAAAHERAAFAYGLPPETGEGHDPQHFLHRELLEYRLVIAGLAVSPVAVAR